MSDFQSLRSFLEERREQLAQLAADPEQFRVDFARLQQIWQQNLADAVKYDVTTKTLSRYPPVLQSLRQAGMLPADAAATQPIETSSIPPPAAQRDEGPPPATTPASSDAPQMPAPAPEPTPSTPARPTGGRPMSDQQLSQSTRDRLAIWDKRIALGKEVLTGLMGLVIVAVTLYVALKIVGMTDESARTIAKDILLFLNGLVGVVLGYYFGRVPGDIRADKAETEANVARSDQAAAEQEASAATAARDRTISEVRDLLDRSSPTERSAGGLTSEQVAQLRDVLRRNSR